VREGGRRPRTSLRREKGAGKGGTPAIPLIHLQGGKKKRPIAFLKTFLGRNVTVSFSEKGLPIREGSLEEEAGVRNSWGKKGRSIFSRRKSWLPTEKSFFRFLTKKKKFRIRAAGREGGSYIHLPREGQTGALRLSYQKEGKLIFFINARGEKKALLWREGRTRVLLWSGRK